MNIQKLQIIVKGITRKVGYIDFDTKVYHTKRQNKNIMRGYYGFGISLPIINYLFEEDINLIAIHHGGKIYWTSVSKFYINGFNHTDQHDKQLILPMGYFYNAEKRVITLNKLKQTILWN